MTQHVTSKSNTKELYVNIGKRLKQIRLNSKGQILRSTPNTAPLICGACNTQPEGLLTTA